MELYNNISLTGYQQTGETFLMANAQYILEWTEFQVAHSIGRLVNQIRRINRWGFTDSAKDLN